MTDCVDETAECCRNIFKHIPNPKLYKTLYEPFRIKTLGLLATGTSLLHVRKKQTHLGLGLVENSKDRLPHTRLSGGNKGMRTVGAEAKEVWLTWGSSRQVYLKP